MRKIIHAATQRECLKDSAQLTEHIVVFGGVFSVGIWLRLHHWLGGRSVWFDEAHFANRILSPSFWSDALQGHYWQTTPFGTAVIFREFVRLFGVSDALLRVPCLVASILSLVLFAKVTRAVFSKWSRVIVFALFALSPAVSHYAGEAKGYSFEILITVLLLDLTVSFGEPKRIRHVFVWFSLLSPWFSYGVYLLFPVVVAELWKQWGRRYSEDLLVALGIFAWSAALHFAWFIYPVSQLPKLGRNFFGVDKVPILSNLKLLFWNLISAGQWAPFAWISVSFLVICFAKSKKGFKLYFAGKWALALLVVAISVRGVPNAYRLFLFFIPLMYLLIGQGMQFLFARLEQSRALSALLAAGLLFIPVCSASFDFKKLSLNEEFREVYDWFASNAEPNDIILVNEGAWEQFQWYERQKKAPSRRIVFGRWASSETPIPVSFEKWLRGTPRLWILLSHVTREETFFPEQALSRYRKKVGEQIRPGVWGFFYDNSISQPLLSSPVSLR